VDDILAEVHKQQSKKNNRNPNPFLEVICIWGWCHDFQELRPPFQSPRREQKYQRRRRKF